MSEGSSIDPATQRCLDKLPPGWENTIISMYGVGCSDREIMRELRLSPKQFRQLIVDTIASPFSEVIEFGRMIAQAWWEQLGRTNLENTKFQTQLWSLQMQNRFGWTSKSEESRTNIQVQDLDDAELNSKLRDFVAKYSIVGKS